MVAIVYSEKYLLHDPGIGHPERPERLTAILDAIKKAKIKHELIEPQPASESDLKLCHTEDLIDQVKEHSKAELMIDADTIPCKDTFATALLAVGGAIKAAELVASGKEDYAFALVRPPGHHATIDRAMGFCFFNNIAIAVQKLHKAQSARRIAVLDIDVHHGNGTQDIFWKEPVLYASLHQYPFYPGTGAAEEIGEGEGKGLKINAPLPAGTSDKLYLEVLDNILEKIENWGAEIIFVSAGFDAHKDDPIGGLNLSTKCYGEIAKRVKKWPSVWVLEGGYNLEAIGNSTVEILKELEK